MDFHEKKRVGVNQMDFVQFVKHIEEHNWKVHGVQIMKDGEVLHQYGDVAEQRYPIYSATKAITSTAVGLAVDEGKFSIEESVWEYLKGEVPAYASQKQIDNLKKITIRRLLTMSVDGYPFRPEGNNWLEFSLMYPLKQVEIPFFSYSNIPAYLVSVALEKALNEHLIFYLTPRLLEPLSIKNPPYGNCPSGHFYGASKMELTVEELGRLGRLYLQKGCFNNQRILSESWIEQATTSHISNREGGYGYFIWKYENGYRISGKWGQRCFVFPEEKMTITYLANMKSGSEILTETMEKFLRER